MVLGCMRWLHYSHQWDVRRETDTLAERRALCGLPLRRDTRHGSLVRDSRIAIAML